MEKELLKIDNNVENSDAHLKYDGDILINADILKGATVEAVGSIIANNVLGAQLIAGGDIIVRKNVESYENNESLIYSKGKFSAEKVFESNVVAEKDVTINIVENSRIVSNRDIFINSYVNSSKISSLKSVFVSRVINVNKPTILESGRSVIIDEKIATLFKEKITLLSRLDNIKKYLHKVDNPEKKEQLQQKYYSISALLESINSEISEMAKFVQNNAVFRIAVKEYAESETTLVMKTSKLNLENAITSSLFTLKDDEIIRKSM